MVEASASVTDEVTPLPHVRTGLVLRQVRKQNATLFTSLHLSAYF